MKVQADFTKISTEFESLPEGVYTTRVVEAKSSVSKKGQLPQIEYVNEVVEPAEFAGRKMTDYVTLKTNKGEVNTIGLGRMKAYHEAVHGEGSATDELDSDDVVGQLVQIVVQNETYKDQGVEKTSSKIKKVLSAN